MTDYRDGIKDRSYSEALARARECEGKERYDKAAAAQRVATIRKRERSSTLNAYECKWCGQWHVGHLRAGPLLRTRREPER